MGFFDHCQPNQRFNSFTGEVYPRGPTTWQTIDWDQRRYISTSVPGYVDTSSDGEDMEENIIQALAKVVDKLEDDVNLVNFSMSSDFISSSSDPADDTASIPLYCPIHMIPKKYRTGHVISRKDLVELDRLSQCVDLVMYRIQPTGSRGVFKYDFHHEHARRNWQELNCWLRLSGHPNIVPFEYIVTDFEDVPGHGTDIEVVVGFTSTFIPGKTLADNQSRMFKLKYLEQLIEVVDDLNLKFGIVHQDIAARNILINPETDTLQLFDFSHSGRLGWKDDENSGEFSNPGSFKSDLNKVVATMYELITRDTGRVLPNFSLGGDISNITGRKWVKHPDVSLDSDVSSYQRTLRCWLRRRNRPHNLIKHFTETQSPLEWPQPWKPEIPTLNPDGNPNTRRKGPRSTTHLPRATLRALGVRFVEWERPAHNRIPQGFCVLADGTLVALADLSEEAQGQLEVVGSRYAGPQATIKVGNRGKGRAGYTPRESPARIGCGR